MAVIKLKRKESAGAPSASDLSTGEVAINTSDKVLFAKDSGGNVVQVANFTTAGASTLGALTDVAVGGSETEGQTLVSDGDGTFSFDELTPLIYSIALG